MDRVDQIIEYEGGEMNDTDTLEFFASLIKDGTCWSLQGSYGRTASSLIENGFISKKGEINWDKYNELVDA